MKVSGFIAVTSSSVIDQCAQKLADIPGMVIQYVAREAGKVVVTYPCPNPEDEDRAVDLIHAIEEVAHADLIFKDDTGDEDQEPYKLADEHIEVLKKADFSLNHFTA